MKIVLLSLLLSSTALFSCAAPASLLEISGAKWPAAKLTNAVLIIIDAQREYGSEGKLPLVGIDQAVTEIATLLARAREAHTPVIHILQLNPKPRPLFTEGTPMAAEFAELQPKEGELVIYKTMPSSFTRTTLDEELRKIGRKDLILVGFMTHMCVSTTARAAIDLGYHSTIVASACATRDLTDPNGGVVTAAELQRAELAALRDRFAAVVPSQTDIAP